MDFSTTWNNYFSFAEKKRYNFIMSIKSIKDIAVPILKQYGVVKASLFGSTVRGDRNEGSDVDLLVEIPNNIKGLDYFGFKGNLQEDLEKELKKKVDLVEYRLIKPELKKYIIQEQVQILWLWKKIRPCIWMKWSNR